MHYQPWTTVAARPHLHAQHADGNCSTYPGRYSVPGALYPGGGGRDTRAVGLREARPAPSHQGRGNCENLFAYGTVPVDNSSPALYTLCTCALVATGQWDPICAHADTTGTTHQRLRGSCHAQTTFTATFTVKCEAISAYHVPCSTRVLPSQHTATGCKGAHAAVLLGTAQPLSQPRAETTRPVYRMPP